MEYYLVYKKEQEAPLLIGADNGFGVFWADQGFDALTNIVSKNPEYIEQIVFDTKNPFLAGELVAHPLTTEKTLIEAVKKFIFCNEGRTHDLLFQNRFMLFEQNHMVY